MEFGAGVVKTTRNSAAPSAAVFFSRPDSGVGQYLVLCVANWFAEARRPWWRRIYGQGRREAQPAVAYLRTSSRANVSKAASRAAEAQGVSEPLRSSPAGIAGPSDL